MSGRTVRRRLRRWYLRHELLVEGIVVIVAFAIGIGLALSAISFAFT